MCLVWRDGANPQTLTFVTFAYPDFLLVPEEHGTAVVDVALGVVVMSSVAPRSAELLKTRGLRVERLPQRVRELEGCVTCVSVRLR